MGQLAEISFVGVAPTVLRPLLSVFLPLSNRQETRLAEFARGAEDDALSLEPVDTMVGEMLMPDMSARVHRYSGSYDVEVMWDLDAVPSKSMRVVIEALHRTAVQAAEKHGINEYYGGLEPSRDEDTRFFTGRHRGPLELGEGPGE